jgi:tRNA (cmo5U34)-methyltransferase
VQFHEAADRYHFLCTHVPLYDRLQEEVVLASMDITVTRMLDLGVGTGETSRRCLKAHPAATLVAIDASRDMLETAARVLGERAELRLGRLEKPLPDGSFDLVVSAFAVHHLGSMGKRDLFRRVAERLSPGGRFVMGDVVIPDEPVPEPTPLSAGEAFPDRTGDLLDWLRQAGLSANVRWSGNDLVVVAASAP